MIRLVWFEYKKLLCSRMLRLGVLFLLGANFFFLYTSASRESIPASCWRSAGGVLRGIPAEEQQAFLEEKIDLLTNLQVVETVYRDCAQGYGGSWNAETARTFSAYKDRYLQGEFLDFCPAIETELQLTKLLLQEVRTVRGYPEFLAEVQTGAQQLGSISVFQQNDWNRRENELTCAAYAGLQGTQITYAPQKGIVQALNFKMSDVFLVFGVLLFAFWSVRAEIESGMLRYVRSFSEGRTRTALAKLTALWGAAGSMTLLLYGTNLLWCAAAYGLGPLDRSIQSLPAFLRCPYPLTVGQYIGVFFLAKWAAACVMGCCVLAICTAAGKSWAAGAFSLLFAGICALLYGKIPGAGNWNFFKYATPVSLLQTNELVGGWQCLHWLGRPVARHAAALCAAGVFFGLGTAVYFLCFQRRGFLPSERRTLSLRRRQITCWKHRSLLRMELFKTFVLQGAGVFVTLLLLVQLQSVAKQENYLHPEELYYRQDMTRLSGRWDAARYAEWEKILDELEPLSHPETLTEAQGGALETRFRVLKERVYPQLLHTIEQQKNGEQTQLVYASGYEQLFDLDGSVSRLQMTLWAGALAALCFSSVFAAERSSRMDLLLASMLHGKETLVRTKLRIAAVTAAVIAALLYLPGFTEAAGIYGLPALSAPARSLEAYQTGLFAGMPLGVLALLDFLGVAVGCTVMAVFVLWMGCRLKNLVLTILLGGLFLAVFPLLEIAGVRGACWLSLYPLFHLANALRSADTGVAALFLLLLWAGAGYLCLDDLRRRFGTSE